ncbi:hypothetical protein N0V85_005242 [Neurospora sp. IMI 360204]|nr:hypothetical protein N0V85_005242 [Neurospora sp. IMI 360204]
MIKPTTSGADTVHVREVNDETPLISDVEYFSLPLNSGWDHVNPFERAFSFHALPILVPGPVAAPIAALPAIADVTIPAISTCNKKINGHICGAPA